MAQVPRSVLSNIHSNCSLFTSDHWSITSVVYKCNSKSTWWWLASCCLSITICVCCCKSMSIKWENCLRSSRGCAVAYIFEVQPLGQFTCRKYRPILSSYPRFAANQCEVIIYCTQQLIKSLWHPNNNPDQQSNCQSSTILSSHSSTRTTGLRGRGHRSPRRLF